jgi:hypothetical protein
VREALTPSAYLDADATIRGNLDARQSVEYAPPGGRGDVRVEAGLRRDLTGDFENLKSRRDAADGRLRMRRSLGRGLRIATTLSWDRTQQGARRTDTPDRSRSLGRGRGMELEVTRALGPAWSVSLLSRGRGDRDATNGGSQRTWMGGPTFRCAPGNRLRVDGRSLWGGTRRSGTFRPAGLYLAAPAGNRLEYDLEGEYRVKQGIALSLTWTGQSAVGRPATYTGRAELRSSF